MIPGTRRRQNQTGIIGQYAALVGNVTQPCASMSCVSNFNAKHGLVVRSEGGRICCDINDLPRWVKQLGAFPAYKCFPAAPLSTRACIAAREHRVVDAGHNLPQQVPEAFADAMIKVREWLSKENLASAEVTKKEASRATARGGPRPYAIHLPDGNHRNCHPMELDFPHIWTAARSQGT
jgi:hypothetical protein